jgi:hypothetical protein
MKHAGAETLASLAPLLARLRAMPALTERTPGSFYIKSKAYLHFHEDPAGPFVDVKLLSAEFKRLRVATKAEQATLVALVAESLRKTSKRK